MLTPRMPSVFGRKAYADARAQDVAKVLHTWQIVDVRGPHEYYGDLGHIHGAKNIPLADVQRGAYSLRKDVPTLVVCHSGGRSTAACEILAQAGFKHLHNLQGGMMGWNRAGLSSCGNRHEAAHHNCDQGAKS